MGRAVTVGGLLVLRVGMMRAVIEPMQSGW